LGEVRAAPARWADLLHELERRLGAWRDAIDGHGEWPRPLAWPSGLGPCPEHLVERARAVLLAQQALEQALASRLEVLGAALRASGRPRRQPVVPLFVDRRC
jgi:hypothetical protein